MDMPDIERVHKRKKDISGNNEIITGQRINSQKAWSIAGSEAISDSIPLHIAFPSIQPSLAQNNRLPLVKPEGSSSAAAGERFIIFQDQLLTDHLVEALKSLEKYLKTNDPKLFRYKFRKQAREQVNFFPDASFTSTAVTKLVFESSQSQSLCEYHQKGKSHTFKADSVIELFGMGFKGEGVGDSSKVSDPKEGHLHCGCPIREVAMEFFLWKTIRAFSRNPALAGKSYTMGDLSKLKPSTRSFWNKSIQDYTGLDTEDLLSCDYGSEIYAIRIALIQLHTQIERLKALRAPLVIQVIFPEVATDNIPEQIRQYGIETGVLLVAQELEKYWCELKAKRQVPPLPFVSPTRHD